MTEDPKYEPTNAERAALDSKHSAKRTRLLHSLVTKCRRLLQDERCQQSRGYGLTLRPDVTAFSAG